MFTVLFFLCFAIGIIATYKLKDTIVEDFGDDYLVFEYLYIAREGYSSICDVGSFMWSIFLYFVALTVASVVVATLWFIVLPLAILFLIIKKYLKKKN